MFLEHNRQILDCSSSPLAISDDLSFENNELIVLANFALVVEKECVFHQLYSSGFHKKHHCLLITGQGYPPLMVRQLVANVSQKTEVYGLFDCNPHGFSIYFAYKYGTVSSSTPHDICPTISWVGLHWQDIVSFGDQLQDFTTNDELILGRLEQLVIGAGDQFADELLKHEIKHLTTSKKKGDIELLENQEQGYLANNYLPGKIRSFKMMRNLI
eukprot:TRINITY_DN54949_c0_g1_i1.p1 TRINITY_DN54949_c0_g1~~TRINITY_DN54949_c0_g1_i1.p1  ORF type:complete len:214 (+),score=65.29 TRINITY_DN54949_c0_g1_i1:871-1512(+)